MVEEIPEKLQPLVPLLHAMGLRWSTHYHPPSQPEAKWAIVNARGAAGRVGMTVDQAYAEALQTACNKLHYAKAELGYVVSKLNEMAANGQGVLARLTGN